MTVDELKEWMDERFCSIEKRMDSINGKVTSHDRWLWLLRGVGMVLMAMLGFIGFKK